MPPEIMVNLWHPDLEIDFAYFQDGEEQWDAISSGYISLKEIRKKIACYEVLWKRLEEQYTYSENLERILKEEH